MGLQRGRGAEARLNAAHVGELVAEIAPLVEGATVVDVQPLPPRDVVLVLGARADPAHADAPERTLRLRLSVDRVQPRLHLQHGRLGSGKRSRGRSFGPFFTRLRELLPGATVRALRQVRADRLVRLELRDLADGSRGALLAELTGGHGNLVLLDGGDRVVEVLVPPPELEGDREPRLVIGRPWEPPPGKPRGAEGGPSLSATLAGAPAAELELSPAARGLDAPLSRLVERVLGGAAAERESERARRALLDRLERKRKKAAALLAGLERRRDAADEAERVRMDGELLQARVGELRRGAPSVVLDDWFAEGQPPRTISLDPRLGPQENVQRIFERYRKLIRARENLDREEALAREKLGTLDALLERARDPAADQETFAALADEGEADGVLDAAQVAPKRRAKPEPRKPYRSFTGSAGSEIRVGRSARDNDDLTFRHARGNDLWLHTADAPGSHVVLKLERGREPDPEEVLDAAHLAVRFSPLEGARRAAVHVARRKLVHKPKGAKPGLVTLSGGKVMDVRIEPARLARLLDPRRARDA